MPKTKVVEKVEAPVTNGVKTYDEKVSDYEEHFDDIGMHDPSTEAAIAQMKTATPRWEESDADRAPDLIARDKVREDKRNDEAINPGDVVLASGETRKEANEKLSEVVTDRKEHDEEEQKMTETGVKTNMARGGSEEAETGESSPKRAKVAVNEAKIKANKKK